VDADVAFRYLELLAAGKCVPHRLWGKVVRLLPDFASEAYSLTLGFAAKCSERRE
jgi:hypothetical protein